MFLLGLNARRDSSSMLPAFCPYSEFTFLVLVFLCDKIVEQICTHMQVCLCGFSCARSGLPLPLSSLCFFCAFILGFKSPYLCPVCPPVIIATIGISCFVVSFLCILRGRYGRIRYPQRPSVSPQAPFPCPTMSLGPSIHVTTHKYPPCTSITIPNPLL